MAELRACFRKIDITPADDGHPLAGYFTPRLSTGALDPLHCRLALFSSAQDSVAIAQIDTCVIRAEEADMIASAVSRKTGLPRERIMVLASHTHTAPALADLYEVPRDDEYLRFLVSRIAQGASTLDAGVEVRPSICRGRAPGLASNRRWYLKDGRVVTNPPRGHASLDRPEGPVDDEVNTVAFVTEDGTSAGMLVGISNHADAIGGNRISADWPGLMEDRIRASLGSAPVVIPVIGAAGNINHFDFSRARDQTNYAEAQRLARAYAETVAASLRHGVSAAAGHVRAMMDWIDVPGIEIEPDDAALARAVLAQSAPPPGGGQLTAEDIFRGDPFIQRMFARSLLDIAAHGPASYQVPLQALRIGSVGILSIPGEPFVEIGLALKKMEGFDLVLPAGLANGYFGYIPLAQCFGRGGYEVKPGPALLCRDAADRILGALSELAARLRSSETPWSR